MYNPYQGQVNNQPNFSNQNKDSHGFANQQPQQPQHHQQQQQHQQQFGNNSYQSQQQTNSNMQGGINNGNFNSIFTDPAAQMGLQFSQTALNASQQYMQNNLQQFVSNEDIKYYFKVSNSYVLKKLMLILFPYRNKTWVRQLRSSSENNGASNEAHATPIEDVNAPDLYIPTMAFLSYILVWALGEGVKGDFHPEMLGYATTRTLAFYIMDLILLRISFYILGISSKNSKIWDLVSYTGYKFVPIFIILLFDTLTNISSIVVKYCIMGILCFSFGFFLMRSLRYVVLPNGGIGGESRMRMQYLFAYCFLVQGLFVWLMV